MKVLSLFSGVGGFDLGLENAGMETVFQCEWDKHATSILQRHWPDIPRWGDITTLTGRHILDHAPVIDVVAWGSPCQDLSVAGKRAGLSGERSGLFHEGIRIIKELRKETNNAYPRISIWENVYGALNSNKGADFGLVLDEMAEAGAMVIEWRVLDAQYFGVPQRRRRVFVIAVFDPRIAANCPDPLLPLRQGVRWNPATSRTTRQTTPRPTTQSLGSGSDIANTISASLYHHGTVVNQDANNGHVVIEPPILIDRSAFNQGVNAQYDTHISDDPVTPSLVARGPHAVATSTIVQPLAFDGYNQTVGNVSQTIRADKSDGDHVGMVLEPFVKAKRAQSASDDETWVKGDINPTINQFDQGDVRATTAIVMRQREGKPGGGKGPLLSEDKSLTLAAAGNDQTLFVEQPIVFENSYRDSARIAEDGITQTLSAKMGTGGGNTPMVAFATNQRAEVRELGDKAVALSAEPGTNQQTYIAIPIQDGREIEKNQNGLGIAESGAPAYTLDQTGAQSVAIGIQGNVIGRQDHNGPAGKGHTEEGDPMFTLNTTDRHAVIQYDGYNQRIYEDDVSVTIRIGRDSSDCIAQPTEPTVFQPGTMTRLGGGVWEGTVPTLRAEVKRGDNEPHIMTEPTMSVRRLTPLECERLMGWPDDWTAGQADTHRYKQCGNGVASPVAQWIGEQILNIPQ